MTLAGLWRKRAQRKRETSLKFLSVTTLTDNCICGHPKINHLSRLSESTKEVELYSNKPCPCGCTTFVKAKRSSGKKHIHTGRRRSKP